MNSKKTANFKEVYKAASINDANQLHNLLECEIGFSNVEDSIARVCTELDLNCVYLSDEIKLILSKKLLNLRFFSHQTEETNLSSEDICERIEFTIELIHNLHESVENDELFIVNLTFIAKQIFTLKGLLKSTYDRMPWEELEFCVLSFIKIFKKPDEFANFSKAILSKMNILSYLQTFGNCLECLEEYVSMNVTKLVEMPKLDRNDVVNEIMEKYPELKPLYVDHERLRDLHSLNFMLTYIDVVENIKLDEKQDKLILIRAFQVISDHLKNTLESPKLSENTINYLLIGLSDNSMHIIIDLQNDLSHYYSPTIREKILENSNLDVLSGIKNDIENIGNKIRYIITKTMMKVIGELVDKFINTDDEEIMKEIALVIKKFHVDPLLMRKRLKNVVTPGLVNNLKFLHSQITISMPNQLFHDGVEIDFKDYCTSYYENYIEVICCIYRLFEKFCMLHENLQNKLNHIKSMKDNLIELLYTIPNKKNVFEQIYISKADFSDKMSLDDELTELLFEVLYVFEMEDILLYDKFISKLKKVDGQKINDKYKKDKEYKGQIVTALKVIFSGITYSEFKNNKRLQTMTEIFLLDLIPLVKKSDFNPGLIFFDDSYPSLMGLELWNHLAHNNVMIEVLMDSIAAIFLFVEELLIEECSDVKLKEITLHDFSYVKQTYDASIKFLNKKQKMFMALEENNFEIFSQCMEEGADIRSRDIDLATCLHFAMTKPENLKLTEFLWKNGLSSRYTNLKGQSALHIAVAKGNPEVVEFLLLNFDSEINYVDSCKRTAAHIALLNWYEPIIRILLNHGVDLTIIDDIGFSPLHYAVVSGKIEAVELFFEKNIFYKLNKYDGSFTALHVAAAYGSEKMVKYLLSKRVGVNATTDRGNTPLHLAIAKGNSEKIETLIRFGADVNSFNSEGYNPLHCACKVGEGEIVKILIEKGANVNISVQHSLAPMHLASRRGYVNVVAILLANNADVNLQSKLGFTPLSLAVKYRHPEVVNLLVKQNGINVNVSNKKGMTPLHYAAFNKDTKTIRNLLKVGASVDSRNEGDLKPLHLAALSGHEATVNILISKNVQARTKLGFLPLHFAAISGTEKMMKKLIDEGSQINATTTFGFNCLHLATRNKRNVADLLIREGIEIDAKTIQQGSTPLHRAVLMNNLKMVKSLLKGGCNINAQDNRGNTALILSSDNCEIVEFLLENKADITIKNNEGYNVLDMAVIWNKMKVVQMCLSSGLFRKKIILVSLGRAIISADIRIFKLLLEHCHDLSVSLATHKITLLHLASSHGKADIVELLLGYDISVNTKGVFDNTPLLIAVTNGHEEIVEMLLNKGALINVTDINGNTPLHIASWENHPKIVEILLSKGANLNIPNRNNCLAVEMAAIKGSLSSIQHFLKKNKKQLEPKYLGVTLLHIASKHGHFEVVKFLLAEGANMHAKNLTGCKPIHEAAQNGFTDIVDFFLDKGMSSNEVGMENWSILHYAVVHAKIDVIKHLIERGCDVNSVSIQGETPLQLAFSFGHVDIAEFLLNNGAICHISFPNELKEQSFYQNFISWEFSLPKIFLIESLFSFIKTGDFNEIERVLAKGVPLNCVDIHKGSPLHFAVYKGNINVVQILLSNNVSTSIVHKNDWTPLHYAVKYSYLEIVFLLLCHGAKFDVESKNGKRPIDFAANGSILCLLQLINICFEKIKKKDATIIELLKKIKCETTLKAVMCAKNKDGVTLIAAAFKNKFPQTKQLEAIIQESLQIQLMEADDLFNQEKYQETKELLLKIYEKRRDILGHENPSTLDVKSRIANVLYKQKLYEEALISKKEIYDKFKKMLGIDNEYTLREKCWMGVILHKQGKNEESLKILEEVHTLQKHVSVANHKDLLMTKNYIVSVLNDMDKFEKALEILESILTIVEKEFGFLNSRTLEIKNDIALNLSKQGRYHEALQLFEQVHEGRRITLGQYHSDTLLTSNDIIDLHLKQRRCYKNSETYKKLSKDQIQTLGSHPDTLHIRFQMGIVQFEQYKLFSAYKLFKEIRDHLIEMQGPNHPIVLKSAKLMAHIQDMQQTFGTNMKSKSFIENMIMEMNEAAKRGDIQIIEKLIRSGMEINEKDKNGRNSLHYAVDGNNEEVIKYLLEHGGDIMETTNNDNTLLHLACNKGQRKIVELILNTANTDKLSDLINAATKSCKTTALHVSAKKGYHEIVHLLLKRGAIYNCEDKHGRRPIDLTNNKNVKKILKLTEDMFVALWKKDFRAFSRLNAIENDEFLCVMNARDSQNFTLLRHLILLGEDNLVTRLIGMM